jgi:hypothetical protein
MLPDKIVRYRYTIVKFGIFGTSKSSSPKTIISNYANYRQNVLFVKLIPFLNSHSKATNFSDDCFGHEVVSTLVEIFTVKSACIISIRVSFRS